MAWRPAGGLLPIASQQLFGSVNLSLVKSHLGIRPYLSSGETHCYPPPDSQTGDFNAEL